MNKNHSNLAKSFLNFHREYRSQSELSLWRSLDYLQQQRKTMPSKINGRVLIILNDFSGRMFQVCERDVACPQCFYQLPHLLCVLPEVPPPAPAHPLLMGQGGRQE